MISICCVTDDKPGHRSQIDGLLQSLSEHTAITTQWFHINNPQPPAQPPDLILAAGHKTHTAALKLKWKLGGKLIILMKPSLPLWLFDLCLIPEHDGIKASPKVFTTIGAINPVRPSASSCPNHGLILIGGPSRHHDWSDDQLLAQLRQLRLQMPEIHWTLTTSRRTPESFKTAISDLGDDHLCIVPMEKTDRQWLQSQFQDCGIIWVTADSVSMIYESLSSGARVGILEVPQRKPNRISHSINKLIEQQQLISLRDLEQGPPILENESPVLNEADRAARYILQWLALSTDFKTNLPSETNSKTATMKVLQILPALNSGGVERGTVDFARTLTEQGHQSLVMSSGGAMVEQLQKEGTEHINFPVHRKSIASLFKVRALRRLLLELDVDVIHLRSRVPAWMTWLALRKIPRQQRPALVSTFHGLYSVNRYSAIMGCGDQVIAISRCVYDYIINNYPKIDAGKITIIHRGVDTRQFNPEAKPPQSWKQAFFSQHPQLQGKPLILMPGRLSRWKGQLQFIELIQDLIDQGTACHGLIVGGPTPGKESYLQELQDSVKEKGLSDHITFLGHRRDIANIYPICSVTCNLSQHAEPFGRTVIESLAMGVPVVSYDYGGPAESLRECFAEGLVPLGDRQALGKTVANLLKKEINITLCESFTLKQQSSATIEVYHKALATKVLQ